MQQELCNLGALLENHNCSNIKMSYAKMQTVITRALHLHPAHQDLTSSNFLNFPRLDSISPSSLLTPGCQGSPRLHPPRDSNFICLWQGPGICIFLKNLFYWSMVDLQCCISLGCIEKWFSYTKIYSFFLFQILFLYRLFQNTEYSSPCYTIYPCYLFYM